MDWFPYCLLKSFSFSIILSNSYEASWEVHTVNWEISQRGVKRSCRWPLGVHLRTKKEDVWYNLYIIKFWRNLLIISCRYSLEPFERKGFRLGCWLICRAHRLFQNNNRFVGLDYFYSWTQNKHLCNSSWCIQWVFWILLCCRRRGYSGSCRTRSTRFSQTIISKLFGYSIEMFCWISPVPPHRVQCW